MSQSRSTAEDVAKRAGVAQSTVSRVFSNSSRISEATRQKVFKAAQELDYRPNHFARSLVTKQSLLVGIVMERISTAFSPYVLEKLTLKLQESGYNVLLFNVSQAMSTDDLLPSALDYQVDALITTSSVVSQEMANVYAKFKTPLILFNRHINNQAINTVSSDDYLGGRLAAEAMIKAGVKRAAFISGQKNTSTTQDRGQGFFEQWEQQGFARPRQIVGDYSYQSGFDAACQFMAKNKAIDGIFAVSDLMAMGAMDALRYKLGLQVPKDVQVIGFDDIPSAARLAYQLTTIRIDVDLMVDKTLELLQRCLTNHSGQIEQVITPVAYVERKSLAIKN